MRLTLGIIFICFGIVLIIASAAMCAVSLVLSKFPRCVGKTYGDRVRMKHKKDVPVYGSRFGGSIRQIGLVKHVTKTTYKCTVGSRTYKIKTAFFETPRQTDYIVTVVCLKRFPRVAYIESDHTGDFKYWAYAFVFVFAAVLLLFRGANLMI